MNVATRSRQDLVYTATMITTLLKAPDGSFTVPVMKKPRKIIVVAADYSQACHYLRAVEARPGTHLIATEPPMIRALSPEDHVVVVQGHDPRGRLDTFAYHLRVSRAHVEYVDLDTIMGVNRNG